MNLSKSASLIVVVALSLLLINNAFAARGGNGGGKGGGKPGSGGETTSVCFVKETSLCETFIAPDLDGSIENGYTPGDEWTVVFKDDFDLPEAINADRSGSFRYDTWSSRYPYGDVKVNAPSGDEGFNVNTTGIEPGIGWTGNIYPDHERLISQLTEDGQSVFSNASGALTIQTLQKLGNWKNRVAGRETLFSGLISSHADPANPIPHGFEFRYGYVEAKVKLPAEGNGIRSAVWLHSDNSFYNAYASDNGQPIPERYEIDFLEYLPNSRGVDEDGIECFKAQSDVFGIPNNTTILTNDTIFHTYHFPPGDVDRSPNNWTFNHEARYDSNRCSVAAQTEGDLDYGDTWHVFGVLWESDKLEFYVDGVKVHSVLEDASYPSCIQSGPAEPICNADVFDSRMYIVASMHMGFQFFEGDTIDMDTFVSGAGPKMEIDYIRVLQKSPTGLETSHTFCGAKGPACGERENPETL